MRKHRLKEGDQIFVGSKDSKLIIYKYSTSCMSCREKKTLDFGNIRLCEKCAIEFGAQPPRICEAADSVFADEHGCPFQREMSPNKKSK